MCFTKQQTQTLQQSSLNDKQKFKSRPPTNTPRLYYHINKVNAGLRKSYQFIVKIILNTHNAYTLWTTWVFRNVSGAAITGYKPLTTHVLSLAPYTVDAAASGKFTALVSIQPFKVRVQTDVWRLKSRAFSIVTLQSLLAQLTPTAKSFFTSCWLLIS